MMQSMTGFGSSQAASDSFGKVSVELRSINHKFLEIAFHLPEGFSSLEEKIKATIESKVKRGRVNCAINISGCPSTRLFINRKLIKKYLNDLGEIKKQFNIKDEISINTLMNLPGIISVEEPLLPREKLWPAVKVPLEAALDRLVYTRKKEGRALAGFLKNTLEKLNYDVLFAKKRYKIAAGLELKKIDTDEARANFLKDSDITEELERLVYHIRNFKNILNKNGPAGKELDFIAQELQRESNTLGAKSFDMLISTRVVQMKSRIEKIREQVQNIE